MNEDVQEVRAMELMMSIYRIHLSLLSDDEKTCETPTRHDMGMEVESLRNIRPSKREPKNFRSMRDINSQRRKEHDHEHYLGIRQAEYLPLSRTLLQDPMTLRFATFVLAWRYQPQFL